MFGKQAGGKRASFRRITPFEKQAEGIRHRPAHVPPSRATHAGAQRPQRGHRNVATGGAASLDPSGHTRAGGEESLAKKNGGDPNLTSLALRRTHVDADAPNARCLFPFKVHCPGYEFG